MPAPAADATTLPSPPPVPDNTDQNAKDALAALHAMTVEVEVEMRIAKRTIVAKNLEIQMLEDLIAAGSGDSGLTVKLAEAEKARNDAKAEVVALTRKLNDAAGVAPSYVFACLPVSYVSEKFSGSFEGDLDVMQFLVSGKTRLTPQKKTKFVDRVGKVRRPRAPRGPRQYRQGEWNSDLSENENDQRLKDNRFSNRRRRERALHSGVTPRPARRTRRRRAARLREP